MFEIYTQWVENPKDAHEAGLALVLKIARGKLAYAPEIRVDERGKPFIDGLHFNISHSHNLVVCAFGDSDIGVDVEKIREWRPRVAKFFHASELSHLEKSKDKNLEFFRIWTMKEAYLKCLGEGISKNLSFNVFDIPDMYTEIRDDYIISVCIKNGGQ